MIKQIIAANSHPDKRVFQKEGSYYLNISEFYYDTIQGEGVYTGQPAAFLRLKGCTMDCTYCDSKEVWRHGCPYTFTELFDLMDRTTLPEKLEMGQHLVITGGSPLLQQKRLLEFLRAFSCKFEFRPFIEIENECVLLPDPILNEYISCWNNSPKLASSGIELVKRWKPEVISFMSDQPNSWFKFVISKESDWEEIDSCFLVPRLIKREQIILMPEGADRITLSKNRDIALQMAVNHGVRYSDRLHIVAWDRKVGV